MQDEKGFVPVRRGIKKHIDEGLMTGQEWMVYSTLLLFADYETGVCYKISAPFLARFLGESDRTISEHLLSLHQKGYINKLKPQGRGKYYPIVINKFLTSGGLLIDARNTLSLKAIVYSRQEPGGQVAGRLRADGFEVASIKEMKKERKQES